MRTLWHWSNVPTQWTACWCSAFLLMSHRRVLWWTTWHSSVQSIIAPYIMSGNSTLSSAWFRAIDRLFLWLLILIFRTMLSYHVSCYLEKRVHQTGLSLWRQNLLCGVRAKRAGREVLRRRDEVARSKEMYLANTLLFCVVRVVTFIRKRSMGPDTNRTNEKRKQIFEW